MKVETIYKSDDGIEFSSKEACLKYETNKNEREDFQKYMNNLLKETKVFVAKENGKKTIYRIKSKQDFDLISNWYCATRHGLNCYSEDIKYYVFEEEFDIYDDNQIIHIYPLKTEIERLEKLIENYKNIK